MTYWATLNDEVKAYFHILCPVFPNWLMDYIQTAPMMRLAGTSLNCGTDHTKMFPVRYWYSNLEHSVGVALIIWHFTHDKRQTLAGLFHDIATPAFKHCIDFMNGDAEKQISTESRTEEMIRESSQIMSMLRRDGIALADVSDYKKYPIADNETPWLAADRLEYNFSGGLSFCRIWSLETIQTIYNNIVITKNEIGQDELAFHDKEICEKYVCAVSNLWLQWTSDADRTAMQFIADVCKRLSEAKVLTTEDLYRLSEQQIVERIRRCNVPGVKQAFEHFQNTAQVLRFENVQTDKYCVNVTAKKRYVDPLVAIGERSQRISVLSPAVAEIISTYLKRPNGGYYTGFDFSFS